MFTNFFNKIKALWNSESKMDKVKVVFGAILATAIVVAAAVSFGLFALATLCVVLELGLVAIHIGDGNVISVIVSLIAIAIILCSAVPSLTLFLAVTIFQYVIRMNNKPSYA